MKRISVIMLCILILLSGCANKIQNKNDFYESGKESISIPKDSAELISIKWLDEYENCSLTKEERTYYDAIYLMTINYNNMIEAENVEDAQNYCDETIKWSGIVIDLYFENKQEDE